MLETSGKQAHIESAAVAPPCAMVIFGAAGDLTKRLVVPALYNLTTTRQLPNGFQLVGVDRAAKSTQEWRAGLTETMKEFIGHEGELEVDRIDQNAWICRVTSTIQRPTAGSTSIWRSWIKQQARRVTMSSTSPLRIAFSAWQSPGLAPRAL